MDFRCIHGWSYILRKSEMLQSDHRNIMYFRCIYDPLYMQRKSIMFQLGHIYNENPECYNPMGYMYYENPQCYNIWNVTILQFVLIVLLHWCRISTVTIQSAQTGVLLHFECCNIMDLRRIYDPRHCNILDFGCIYDPVGTLWIFVVYTVGHIYNANPKCYNPIIVTLYIFVVYMTHYTCNENP
jgi:hypothetical protein